MLAGQRRDYALRFSDHYTYEKNIDSFYSIVLFVCIGCDQSTKYTVNLESGVGIWGQTLIIIIKLDNLK